MQVSQNIIRRQIFKNMRDKVCSVAGTNTNLKMIYNFCIFAMAKLIELAKMAGVMYEADHTYSIRSV